MTIQESIPLIDDTLGSWSEAIGRDLDGYRNHVYRMVNFAFAMGEWDEEARQKIVIAGCFHDIGIWPERTLDYLGPSADRAAEFLLESGLEKWQPQIRDMICLHHKLRPHKSDPLVEAFRKGDLVDFSLGVFKCGLPRSFVSEVKSAFPNAGFHKCLVRIASRWIVRHPLDPVPVLRF
ncbi:MAG TPA: hypothetical protein VFZ49_09135 [Pyrinomonadaceae bacterium]